MSNPDYHGWMDQQLAELRRRKLEMLIQEAGSAVSLAELANRNRPEGAAELAESYISRMRSGLKPISGDMTTRLERATGKPPGWMSNPDNETVDATKGEKYWPFTVSIDAFDKLSPRSKQKANDLLSALVVGLAAEELIPAKPRRMKQSIKKSGPNRSGKQRRSGAG